MTTPFMCELRDSVKDTWNGECEGEIKGYILCYE